MPLFLSASSNPGAASWVNGALAATPYAVGPNQEYTTIQSAIDAAVSDGRDATNPAVVVVEAGTYAEDITMAPGVFLQAVFFSGYSAFPGSIFNAGLGNTFMSLPTVIQGTITCDFGAGTLAENATGICGFRIEGPSLAAQAVHVTGANPTSLLMASCSLNIPADGNTGVLVDNSGAETTFVLQDSYLYMVNPNTDPAVDSTGSTANIAIVRSNIVTEAHGFGGADVIVRGNGGGELYMLESILTGGISLGTGGNNYIRNCDITAAFSDPVISMGSDLRISGGRLTSAIASAYIVRTGGTLTVEQFPAIEPGSGIPLAAGTQGTVELSFPQGLTPNANWAGAEPTELQQAWERITDLLVTLNGGAIP